MCPEVHCVWGYGRQGQWHDSPGGGGGCALGHKLWRLVFTLWCVWGYGRYKGNDMTVLVVVAVALWVTNSGGWCLHCGATLRRYCYHIPGMQALKYTTVPGSTQSLEYAWGTWRMLLVVLFFTMEMFHRRLGCVILEGFLQWGYERTPAGERNFRWRTLFWCMMLCHAMPLAKFDGSIVYLVHEFSVIWESKPSRIHPY